MKEQELFEHLAALGIRLFAVVIGQDKRTFIHPNKTTEEWRSDIRLIKTEINRQKNEECFGDDNVYNEVNRLLMSAGYHDVDDIISDVYEGRVALFDAALEDDPAHEEQADGFGHYGWESKTGI